MTEGKRGQTFIMQGASGRDAPIEFTTFILGLASTALLHLGEVKDPETGQRSVDLVLSRQSVELLSLLRDKTKGNLSASEEKFFDELLADVRLRFVRASRP